MNGRFLGRVVGPTSGNVLLREAHYRAQCDNESCARIARSIVAGKIHNMRSVLLRAGRETTDTAKIVLAAYQKRKQTEIHHSLLKSKTPLGLVPHLQVWQ